RHTRLQGDWSSDVCSSDLKVVHHFAAARRVADMHRFLEIEMCGQRCEIVDVVIHVMAATGLSGTAMAAAVVGDDSIAVVEEEHRSEERRVGKEWRWRGWRA